MNTVIRRSWRDAASLIVLSRSSRKAAPAGDTYNYDVLLQKRTQNASFKNSIVFPGGVTDAADASPEWLHLLHSFGYTREDFESLHHADAPQNLLFENNPVLRHISLRITAIRETFEELGLLVCSQAHKGNSNTWVPSTSDIDFKHWQQRVSKDPKELLTLCQKLNCYPDVWSLHYWSSWLTPSYLPKRFNSAFFITALKDKPALIESKREVVNVEWTTPLDILTRNKNSEVLLYPPQSYELNKLAHWHDIDKLIEFARDRSKLGNELFYHSVIKTKDGKALVLPGDDLYPSNVDYYSESPAVKTDKTLTELRDTSKKAHRFEFHSKTGTSDVKLVLKNLSFDDTDMGESVIPVYVTMD